MEAKRVAEIYQLLDDHGIDVWLQGGWGVDALLGRQTREHKDLDLLVTVDDVIPLMSLLASHGFDLSYYWEENRWVWQGDFRVATAFVLCDQSGNELDFHAVHFGDDGGALPAFESDRVFRPKDLAGVGSISGLTVRCYSAEMQVRTHRAYELPEGHAHDLRLLREELGVDIGVLLEERTRSNESGNDKILP